MCTSRYIHVHNIVLICCSFMRNYIAGSHCMFHAGRWIWGGGCVHAVLGCLHPPIWLATPMIKFSVLPNFCLEYIIIVSSRWKQTWIINWTQYVLSLGTVLPHWPQRESQPQRIVLTNTKLPLLTSYFAHCLTSGQYVELLERLVMKPRSLLGCPNARPDKKIPTAHAQI